jgi:hypothetical protein
MLVSSELEAQRMRYFVTGTGELEGSPAVKGTYRLAGEAPVHRPHLISYTAAAKRSGPKARLH